VVVGGFGDLQGMNPLVTSDNNSNQIQREMLIMSLVKYDENIELVPYLAERWDTVRVHPDTLELTWHIRQDVRWHDGTPTTGEDVVFTFERITDPRTAFPNLQRLQPLQPRGGAGGSVHRADAAAAARGLPGHLRDDGDGAAPHPGRRAAGAADPAPVPAQPGRERAVPLRAPRRRAGVGLRGESRLPGGARRPAVRGPAWSTGTSPR
jgi:hypothetical protein